MFGIYISNKLASSEHSIHQRALENSIAVSTKKKKKKKQHNEFQH